MTERLSQENLNSILDAGHRGFKTIDNGVVTETLFPKLDLKAIISSPKPKQQIQNLSPQVLFHALVRAGLSDCLEVLPLLSSEQFVRICDYDIWHEDRLVPKQAFYWLGFYREVSPVQMYERFRQLDEEYQIALLSPYCTVFTNDEYEKMTEEQQDLLYRFPNDSLYYSVNTGDADLHKGICSLVDAAMSEDMSYAMTVLSAAAFSPPNEQEELIRQFRNARLEEDGFLSYEESLSFFTPINPDEEFSLSDWAISTSKDLTINEENRSSFLAKVLNHLNKVNQDDDALVLQQSLIQLTNAMCNAAKVEPDDLSGLKDLLSHTSSLVSFSLETLSKGNVSEASAILSKQHPKKIYQWGLALVHQLRIGIIEAISQSTIPKKFVEKLSVSAKKQKFGCCQENLDKNFLPILGQEHTELLKAIFNRFPLAPVQVKKGKDNNFIAFKPLSSLAEFKRLISFCESLISKLQLARHAFENPTHINTSIDTIILQGFLQTSLGKPFISKTPDQKELEQFHKLEPTQFKTSEALRSEISSLLQEQDSWLFHRQGFVRNKLASHSALSLRAIEDFEDLYHYLRTTQTQAEQHILDLFSNPLVSIPASKRTSNMQVKRSEV
ncbi:MAG: DUF6178 family protein [Oligoflexales bacterium]